MMLTSENLIHYLLGRGLLDPGAVVDGDVAIAAAARRHNHFKVFCGSGPGLFVKQPRAGDPETALTLQQEGKCFWLARSDPDFAVLLQHLPVLRDFDPQRNALVVELFPGATGLLELCLGGELPDPVAGELGQRLGELHAATARIEPARLARLFPGNLPPVLALGRTPADGFRAYGPAAAAVLEQVRADPASVAALEELAGGWRRTALIHGDVKWDNLLLTGPPGEKRLRLVDWELADHGDPAWDVGAVFQSFLAVWVWSMPDAPAAGAELAARAARPLPAMWPAIAAFWSGYCQAAGAGVGASAAARELRRCLRYGAVRMIQTAFEMAVAGGRTSPQALVLLRLSRNILINTPAASRRLLGL